MPARGRTDSGFSSFQISWHERSCGGFDRNLGFISLGKCPGPRQVPSLDLRQVLQWSFQRLKGVRGPVHVYDGRAIVSSFLFSVYNTLPCLSFCLLTFGLSDVKIVAHTFFSFVCHVCVSVFLFQPFLIFLKFVFCSKQIVGCFLKN